MFSSLFTSLVLSSAWANASPLSNVWNARLRARAGYALTDVASHKSATDAWIVINSVVYDVTKYLDNHGGGADVILKVAGTAADNTFYNCDNNGGHLNVKIASQKGVTSLGTINGATPTTAPKACLSGAAAVQTQPASTPAAASATPATTPAATTAAATTSTPAQNGATKSTVYSTSTTYLTVPYGGTPTPAAAGSAAGNAAAGNDVTSTSTLLITSTSYMTVPAAATGAANAGAGANIKPAAPCTGGTQYTVVAGDDCWDLSSKIGLNFDTLQSLNPGICGVTMDIGQVLCITGATNPPSSSYKAGGGAASAAPAAMSSASATGGTAPAAASATGTASGAVPTFSSYVNPPLILASGSPTA